PTESERIGSIAEHHKHVSGASQEVQVDGGGTGGGPVTTHFSLVPRPARRIREPQHEEREHYPGCASDKKRLPPSKVMTHQTADDVAERSTYRDRHVENREHPATLCAGKAIGQQCRRNGNVG